jgi:hypothetical protein
MKNSQDKPSLPPLLQYQMAVSPDLTSPGHPKAPAWGLVHSENKITEWWLKVNGSLCEMI